MVLVNVGPVLVCVTAVEVSCEAGVGLLRENERVDGAPVEVKDTNSLTFEDDAVDAEEDPGFGVVELVLPPFSGGLTAVGD